MMWVIERAGGGRGFGFTGGHYHKNWGDDNFRKVVLNAILWIAHIDVPAGGVESKITEDDLKQNLDPKPTPAPKPAASAPAENAKPVFSSGVIHTEPVVIKAALKDAKELYLVVTDAGDGIVADWADWMEPTLIKADGSKIKLTELKPKTERVGFGELGVNKNARGQELKVKGEPVAFGFAAHAPSLIAFDLPAGVVAFEGKGGVDNGGTDQGHGATVTFQIYTSNPGEKVLASSEQKTNPSTKPYGIEAAKDLVKTMVTPEGLEASLFAAEPMIQNPTNIDIDPRGRVWATECVNYRKYMGLRPEGDRVVILEDTNGDGIADKETTFFQDTRLTNPLGICVLPTASGKGTQVIVSAAPNVWLLTDTTGSGKADKAEILFKVGGVWNYDHQIHAFSFGPDGKFYFNGGNSVTELFWPDGTIVKDVAGNEITGKGKPYRQGMVFRCDIDLTTGKASNVETLGWNFRNNYEVAVDSFGTLWQSDNDDDGNKGVRINYVMEFGNYGYQDEMTGAGWQAKRTNMEEEIPKRHWHLNDPGVVPNLLQTGAGSPTGILVNEGTTLGTQFTNQVIHCDAGPRVVRAYPVENDGAGYKATITDILTAPGETWYRPADCAIAPDGTLFVADWFDPGVGGHAMGDNEAGHIRGRIYRVAPKGLKYVVQKTNFSTTAGCIDALQSPNKSTQFVAWEKLHAMGEKAEPELSKLAKNQNPRFRARALQLLARIKGNEQKTVKAAIADSDANVRILGLRIARALNLDVIPFVKTLAKDASPQVRRDCAIALRHSESPEVPALWTQLALQHDGSDRWYLEALGIGADGQWDKCLDAYLAAGGNINNPAGRDIVWRSRAAKTPSLLVKIITDSKTSETERPRYIRSLDFLKGPEKDAALLEMATGALK
jgi:putative membrane-bound dehydrogenase-like protein